MEPPLRYPAALLRGSSFANVITVLVINISGAGEYIFVLEFIFFIIVHKILP